MNIFKRIAGFILNGKAGNTIDVPSDRDITTDKVDPSLAPRWAADRPLGKPMKEKSSEK